MNKSSCYFFICLMLMMLLSSSSLVNSEVVCPPFETYAPCSCGEYLYQQGTILPNCAFRSINDSQVSDILDIFLTTPGVSPLWDLDLSRNQLNRIPAQINSFTQLKYVYLNNNNITSIDSGALRFTDATNPAQHLWFYNNPMTTIAPGAFTQWPFST